MQKRSREELATMALEITRKAMAMLSDTSESPEPASPPARPPLFNRNHHHHHHPKEPVEVEESDESDEEEDEEDDAESEDVNERKAGRIIEKALEVMDDVDYSSQTVKRKKFAQNAPEKKSDKKNHGSAGEEKESTEEWDAKYKERRALTAEERECILSAINAQVEDTKNNLSQMPKNGKLLHVTTILRDKFPPYGHIKGVNFSEQSMGKYKRRQAHYIHLAASYYVESGIELNDTANKQGRYGTIANAVKVFAKILKERSPLSCAFQIDSDGVSQKSEKFDEVVQEVAWIVLFMQLTPTPESS